MTYSESAIDQIEWLNKSACRQAGRLKYRVDPDRIYLTGLSMGGFGTWSLSLEHPEEFATVLLMS